MRFLRKRTEAEIRKALSFADDTHGGEWGDEPPTLAALAANAREKFYREASAASAARTRASDAEEKLSDLIRNIKNGATP